MRWRANVPNCNCESSHVMPTATLFSLPLAFTSFVGPGQSRLQQPQPPVYVSRQQLFLFYCVSLSDATSADVRTSCHKTVLSTTPSRQKRFRDADFHTIQQDRYKFLRPEWLWKFLRSLVTHFPPNTATGLVLVQKASPSCVHQ